jgi:hypothetical protein
MQGGLPLLLQFLKPIGKYLDYIGYHPFLKILDRTGLL